MQAITQKTTQNQARQVTDMSIRCPYCKRINQGEEAASCYTYTGKRNFSCKFFEGNNKTPKERAAEHAEREAVTAQYLIERAERKRQRQLDWKTNGKPPFFKRMAWWFFIGDG